jgi:succinate dehydrogenase / fumarate reductase membrane anchor subunit
MAMKTPLGHVRGLGSAKGGTHHWWMQRVTAIALVPLVIWFVASMVGLIGADRATVVFWLKLPVPAVLMVLFMVTGFYHLKLGLQVIIEDYVHAECVKVSALLLNSFACIGLAAASIFAVLKIALGS